MDSKVFVSVLGGAGFALALALVSVGVAQALAPGEWSPVWAGLLLLGLTAGGVALYTQGKGEG